MDRIVAWLAESYWAGTQPEAAVRRSWDAAGVTLGLYHGGEMIGCARAVTDFTRFAYLSDVYVEPEHRGHGLGRWLVQTMLDHPDVAARALGAPHRRCPRSLQPARVSARRRNGDAAAAAWRRVAIEAGCRRGTYRTAWGFGGRGIQEDQLGPISPYTAVFTFRRTDSMPATVPKHRTLATLHRPGASPPPPLPVGKDVSPG